MKKNAVPKNNNNIIRPNNSSRKQVNKASIPSNSTSVNPIKANNANILPTNPNSIYDGNFISLINQLSKSINLLYKSNNLNFSKLKFILENNNISDINKIKNEREDNIDNKEK